MGFKRKPPFSTRQGQRRQIARANLLTAPRTKHFNTHFTSIPPTSKLPARLQRSLCYLTNHGDLLGATIHACVSGKMPSLDGIDVCIIVDGEPLPEYSDPHTNLDGERLLTKYVEVKAGQKFGLRIKLLQGFELKRSKDIYCGVQIDHHKQRGQYVLEDTSHMEQKDGRLQQDYTIMECWNRQNMWVESQSQWMVVEWVFGALETSEK